MIYDKYDNLAILYYGRDILKSSSSSTLFLSFLSALFKIITSFGEILLYLFCYFVSNIIFYVLNNAEKNKQTNKLLHNYFKPKPKTSILLTQEEEKVTGRSCCVPLLIFDKQREITSMMAT